MSVHRGGGATAVGAHHRRVETEWVLRTRYGFDRAALLTAFDALLSVPELALMEELAIERALHLFRQDGAPDSPTACISAWPTSQALAHS